MRAIEGVKHLRRATFDATIDHRAGPVVQRRN